MLKIAITGPESTGKSSLCQELAEYYKGSWVEEYARAYLENLDRPYIASDILKIAKGQVALEDKIAQNNQAPLLFCDTEMLVCKIWQEFKYQKVDNWIEESFQKRHYDLFLLCDIDLNWEDDPLRENPSMTERKVLFNLYKQHLESANKRFKIIGGVGKERLQRAIIALDQLLI